MHSFDPSKHHRRSIRLRNYDYSQSGFYFITICCKNRAHLFGEVKNGAMMLNVFGQIAWNQWLASATIRDNCKIHESIIMPNHIHGIIEIVFQKESSNETGKFKSPSQTIGSIIRGFKIATIKKIKEAVNRGELQFAPPFAPTSAPPFAPAKEKEIILKLDFKIWQRNYYEHIIRDERAYYNISNYILNNPKKWTEDKFHS